MAAADREKISGHCATDSNGRHRTAENQSATAAVGDARGTATAEMSSDAGPASGLSRGDER
jgi:hypothetical protein